MKRTLLLLLLSGPIAFGAPDPIVNLDFSGGGQTLANSGTVGGVAALGNGITGTVTLPEWIDGSPLKNGSDGSLFFEPGDVLSMDPRTLDDLAGGNFTVAFWIRIQEAPNQKCDIDILNKWNTRPAQTGVDPIDRSVLIQMEDVRNNGQLVPTVTLRGEDDVETVRSAAGDDAAVIYGGWNHYAVVADGEMVRFYHNGLPTMDEGRAIPPRISDNVLFIGGSMNGRGVPFDLGGFQIYNEALNAEEVKALAAEGNADSEKKK